MAGAGMLMVAPAALIVTSSAPTIVHCGLIIALATRHRLPAVYRFRFLIGVVGGLISYGPDTIEPFRRAAGYVDRTSRVRSRPTCRFRPRPSTSW